MPPVPQDQEKPLIPARRKIMVTFPHLPAGVRRRVTSRLSSPTQCGPRLRRALTWISLSDGKFLRVHLFHFSDQHEMWGVPTAALRTPVPEPHLQAHPQPTDHYTPESRCVHTYTLLIEAKHSRTESHIHITTPPLICTFSR